MRSYEFTAKTVEKAIKEGLETLGKNQEDVDIEIVNEGGFFKKAKVIIKIEDEIKIEKKDVEKPKIQQSTAEPQKEMVSEKVEKQEKTEADAPAEDNKKETKTEETIQINQADEEIIKTEENKKFEGKVEKTAQKTEKKAEKAKKSNEYVVPTEEELAEKRRKFAEKHFENNQTSLEFVQGLLNVLKIEGTVTLEETKDASEILIETEDAGKVIGYRGDSISAIQYLANIIEGNKNPHAKRVAVDSGDYKQKREQSLRALAIRIAGKVSETGRAYKLEPMTAYERRIVHTELQNYPSVETHSEGVEPFRRIVVTKKK